MENFVVFILDENGEYFSADGQNRFRMLTGEDAYKYRFSEEGQQRKYADHTIGNSTILFEVKSEILKKHEAAENHSRYIRRWKVAIDYEEISANTFIEDNKTELIETITDSTIDIEEEVLKKLKCEELYEAIQHLSPNQRDVIYHLYLAKPPLSLRKYAKWRGIPHMTVQNRKKAALEKIKNYYKKNGTNRTKSHR